MATFVIVHGGWGGGWEWRDVSDQLRRRGDDAFTPTLTGVGEREHLAGLEVDLNTHVRDVIGVLEWEDLEDVVLVGHSSAGMVITGVADKVPHRLALLVYVDAPVPEDGQCLLDLGDPDFAAALVRSAEAEGGWRVPFPFGEDIADYPEPVARRYRSTFHPLAAFTQPLHLSGSGDGLKRAYVRCTRRTSYVESGPGADALSRSAEAARAAGWIYREIEAAHDVQIEDPEGVAALLHELATASG